MDSLSPNFSFLLLSFLTEALGDEVPIACLTACLISMLCRSMYRMLFHGWNVGFPWFGMFAFHGLECLLSSRGMMSFLIWKQTPREVQQRWRMNRWKSLPMVNLICVLSGQWLLLASYRHIHSVEDRITLWFMSSLHIWGWFFGVRRHRATMCELLHYL